MSSARDAGATPRRATEAVGIDLLEIDRITLPAAAR